MTPTFLALMGAYLIGSIPWSFITAYALKGIDLRRAGSRRTDAANARRLAGPLAGGVATLLDFSKGLLSIYVARALGIPAVWWPLCGWCTLAGHFRPPWPGVTGGTGTATCIGAFAGALFLESAAVTLIAATAWVTFGGAFLLCLSALWPLAPILGLLRGTVLPAAALGYAGLACWMILLGRRRIASETKILRQALSVSLVRRKLYRYSALLFPCLVYPVWGIAALRLSLWTVAAVVWILELARFRMPHLNETLQRLFRPLIREREKLSPSGTAYYLLGSALAASFPERFGVTAIIMLTLGDSWAALYGGRYGRHRWAGNKSLEGSLACLAVSLAGGLIFSSLVGGPAPHLVLGGAVAATVTEGLSRKGTDNLTMAPAAAAFMWLLDLILR